METSEITDCINKLIGTIKSLEGHIDALQTENTLLESENESMKNELSKVTTNNSCRQTPSTTNLPLLRNNLIVAVAPYVLEKTEVDSYSMSSGALSEAHLKRAAANIYRVVDRILNVSKLH